MQEVKSAIEENETYAEVQIGDLILMIVEPRENTKPPNCSLWVYVSDVEDAYQKTLINGSTSLMKPTIKYGTDEIAIINDPFGIQWRIASYKGWHQIIENQTSSDNHYWKTFAIIPIQKTVTFQMPIIKLSGKVKIMIIPEHFIFSFSLGFAYC